MRQIYLSLLLLTILISQSAAAKHVLFDQAHNQRFVIDDDKLLDLSNFAKIFTDQNDTVDANHQTLTAKILAKTDVLIISGAFSAYQPKELESIVSFVTTGGNLCIMLHVGPINGKLLSTLNVAVTNGVIKEQSNLVENRRSDFTISNLKQHPIFENVSSVNFYGSWAIKGLSPNIDELAFSSPAAWVDLNRNNKLDQQEPTGNWPVALVGQIGSGHFVVFGDDAIFQNRFLSGNNRTVAKNLARWLQQSVLAKEA